MQYLLDTHVLLWFLEGDEQLPEKVGRECNYFLCDIMPCLRT